MQDEIVAGLKNALERGDSMENAIQSFINAGYNPAAVREAAQFLSTGASAIVLTPQTQQSMGIERENKLEAPTAEYPISQPKVQQPIYQQKPSGSIGKVIIIVILIILLIAILGAIVATLISGDKILSWLKL